MSDTISNALNCTPLESADLERKGLAFAEALTKLGQSYATEHVLTSMEVEKTLGEIRKRRDVRSSGRAVLDRVTETRARARLLGGVKTMWLALFAAQKAEEELIYVIQFHDVGRIDETITAIFEALHAMNRLPSAQSVAEGREVYDRLVRVRPGSLQWGIGFERPDKDKLRPVHERDPHFRRIGSSDYYLRFGDLL